MGEQGGESGDSPSKERQNACRTCQSMWLSVARGSKQRGSRQRGSKERGSKQRGSKQREKARGGEGARTHERERVGGRVHVYRVSAYMHSRTHAHVSAQLSPWTSPHVHLP